MQYIYAIRNALLDGSQIIVALTNVCATQLEEASAQPKDRNFLAFAVLCLSEPIIVDSKSPTALKWAFWNPIVRYVPLCRITPPVVSRYI